MPAADEDFLFPESSFAKQSDDDDDDDNIHYIGFMIYNFKHFKHIDVTSSGVMLLLSSCGDSTVIFTSPDSSSLSSSNI